MGHCIRCNKPNEYQPEHYTCCECKMMGVVFGFKETKETEQPIKEPTRELGESTNDLSNWFGALARFEGFPSLPWTRFLIDKFDNEEKGSHKCGRCNRSLDAHSGLSNKCRLDSGGYRAEPKATFYSLKAARFVIKNKK